MTEFVKLKSTDTIFLIGSGSSLNEITEDQWAIINKYDNMGVNNIFYHPFFIPKALHMELKKYDWEIAKERIEEKWEMGWKNVSFIFPVEKYAYLSGAVGHSKNAKIYTYRYVKRGLHPKKHLETKIDANFDPHKILHKSYDSSVSVIIQMLYLMGYTNVILWGLDMSNSKYFWTDMKPEVRGIVHDEWNKQREGKSKDEPHNASHLKGYIVDFNNRFMKPKGKNIYVGHKSTALYPELDFININDL